MDQKETLRHLEEIRAAYQQSIDRALEKNPNSKIKRTVLERVQALDTAIFVLGSK